MHGNEQIDGRNMCRAFPEEGTRVILSQRPREIEHPPSAKTLDSARNVRPASPASSISPNCGRGAASASERFRWTLDLDRRGGSGRGRPGVHIIIDVADHHLLPGLLAPG